MATWTGIGMNYGHQTQVGNSSYSTITTQVENDYAYLQSVGVTRLRIAMPQFDSTVSLPNCQDLVTRALAHKFYVVWGVVAGFGSSTLTATRWASAKTYIVNTLAPWAQSNGLPELNLTNESELAVDGTTLTAATVRSDIRSMATTIKANGFTGKLTYSTSVLSTYRTPWANEGIGDLDYIAWNSYDTISNFNANKPVIVSQFGSSKTYISEFGSITNGRSDYASEQAYHDDVLARINSIRNAGIPYGYFFCYRDGAFGMPINSFGLVQTTITGNLGGNWAHYALRSVTGTRLYASRTFGSPTQFGTGINAPEAEPLSLSESPSLTGSSSLASEPVSVSEATPSFVGQPQTTDNVSLNELNTSTNTTQITDNVSLDDLDTFANTIQIDAELTPIDESATFTGQNQSSDNVQVDESNPSLQSHIVYALRTFGSPVKFSTGPGTLTVPAESVSLSESIISRKKYALRVFGSTIKIGVVANTMSISETTPISEIATLSSSTTLSAESVSISETTPSLTGLPLLSDTISLNELNSSSNSTQFIDNVQLLEILGSSKYALRVFGAPVRRSSAGSVGSRSISEAIGVAENVSLSATESTSETVQILEILLTSGSPSFVDTTPISDTTSSQASSTIAAEAISLSDILAQAGSSSLQSEAVSISDTTSQSLSMAINESAQISEQTLFATNTSFIEQATISDVLALLGLLQFTESAQIAESTSQTGQPQFIDNVQLLENDGITGVSTLAGETALVSEQSALTGLSQIIEVGTQLSDALTSLFGSLTNAIQIKKYALRTFGSPVEYNASSSTDVISLAEMPSLSGSGNISPEAASLSDFFTQTGLFAFAEAASPNDALSLASSSLIIEIIPISESSSLAGSGQIIEIIPIIEINPSFLGSSQTSEAIQLADLLSLVGLPNLTESTQLGDLTFFVNTTQNIDFSSISELTSLGSSQFIADTAQLQLSDFLSLSGLLQSIDNVQILEIATPINSYHVFIIARGRDGIAIAKGK